MTSNEYYILLKNDEYQQIKKNIENIQIKIQKLEVKLNIIKNKNIFNDILCLCNKYFELFLLFILESIIDIPAE